MSEFVFATYVNEIKVACANPGGNDWLIGLLFDSIVKPTCLEDKNGELLMVTKSFASELVNRKRNVPKKIKKASCESCVTESIEKYFEEKVVSELQPTAKSTLIHKINTLLSEDPAISDLDKTRIGALADLSTIAAFLAQSFLLVLTVPNKIKQNKAKTSKKQVSTTELEEISIPSEISVTENNYTTALFAAYGQAEGINDFTKDMLEHYPRHKSNFADQRKYYYAAEAVRRGTRDLYSKKEKDQFEVLKSEMYEGVIETWEDDAKNGIERMRHVLTQATSTSLDKCRICRDTEWVGNSQRKGVCHFLVEDGRLKGWVRDDDEQSV